MRKIFIDAGHNFSLFDTGAAANNMREQDITFEVSSLLAEILKNDFDVQLSRPTLQTNLGSNFSSSLNSRWQMANQWGADCFMSLHVNAGGGTGAETFFFRDGGERGRRSEAFAKAINDTYAAEMGLRNRGVKPDTQTSVGSIGVLRSTTMPAVLPELAFIDSPLSNPDVGILRNRRRDMAAALAKGVYQYFGMKQTLATTTGNAINESTVKESRILIDILGTETEINGHITNGVTWTQFRPLLEALGYDVDWDDKRRMPVVRPQTVKIDILGTETEISGHITNGVTWIQFRPLLEGLGFDVTWDGERRMPVVRNPEPGVRNPEKAENNSQSLGASEPSGSVSVTAEELEILRKITHAEARGEDEKGQILVVNVILNRVKSPWFPNTIREVVFAPNQFEPTRNGTFEAASPGALTIAAVGKALGGTDHSQGATYFRSLSGLTPEGWHERAVREGKLRWLFDHGNHRFYIEA